MEQTTNEFNVDGEIAYVSLSEVMMDVSSASVFQELGLSEDYFLQRGLARHEEAQDLVVVHTDDDGRVHELVAEASQAWHAMKAAGKEAGHDLFIVSAFRSVSRQAEIVRAKHFSGIGNDEIFSVSAPPGYSEHHTGRAIDVSTPGYSSLEEEFEQSEAFAWLQEHATHFGFSMTYPRGNEFGYLYEPWHWCFEGDQGN